MPTLGGAFTPLAWTIVLALFETTVVALLVWGWTRLRPSGPARRHTVASLALFACLAAAGLTYAALRWSPATQDAVLTFSPPAAADYATWAVPARQQSDSKVSRPTPSPRAFLTLSPSVLAALTIGWIVTAGALLVRLLGGLLLVRSLRSRAQRVNAPSVHAIAASLTAQFGLAGRIEWLQSPEIDAPAAVGWRHPAVLLPAGLHESTPSGLLEPLIAHELEHVRCNDSLQAVIEGVIDALLFHCPGARWLSQQVRLAREERCDDAALRVCGERVRCAEALARLVGVQRSVPVMGAVGQDGPSLSKRICRLLEGDKDMRRLTLWQLALLGCALVATASLGLALTSRARADSAAMPSAVRAVEGFVAQPRMKRPPSGYFRTQPGAPVSITQSTSDGRYVFQFTRVRNVSEDRVTGLRFVAVMPDPLRASPVRIVESEMIATSLEPGQASELQLDLLPLEALGAGPQRAQPMLGLIEARFADEDGWSVRLDGDARDAEAALYLEKPSVAKALVGAPPPAGSRDGVCRDHRGMPYSQGALVPVLGEASSFARCDKSAWMPAANP